MFELPIQNVVALSNMGQGFLVNQTDPNNPQIEVRQPSRITLIQDGATEVSALTQNVWTDIDCNWAPSGAIKDFTNTADTVTYTGADPAEFLVLMNLRGRMSSGGSTLTQLEIAVAVNGTNQPGEGTARLDALDDNGAQLQTMITLNNGDVVTPRINNVENNNDLDLHGITITLVEW